MPPLPIQAKLKVGAVDDPLEHEADRIADQVMRMPAPAKTGLWARPPGAANAPGRSPEGDEINQTNNIAVTVTSLVQRAPYHQLASIEPGADFESRLSTSVGNPLPANTRAFMEPRFGADFSGVRLHTGSEAEQFTRAVNAQAFTHGQDIYLGEGLDDLESSAGKQLLAHELTHTIQQAAGNGVSKQGTPALIQRQHRTKEELQKRLAEVQRDLNTGTGVRSPESTAKLKAEEQDLLAALKQASVDELQRQLEANRQKQSIGSGVRSPEAIAKLKEEQNELQMRVAIATSVAVNAPNIVPAGPGQPFVNWGGGNLRGIPAEGQVLAGSYPGATTLPRGYPGVDFVEGGNRTPLTGFGRGQAGKLPLSKDSVFIEGGTLIQLKTIKNLDPSYQEPNNLFNTLYKGMEKLASIKPGAGKSQQVSGEFFRVEHSGTAERKIFHVEMEAPPTPEQAAQIERLKEAGKSFKDFGPGEEIEVVINWPGSGPKSFFKVTPEGVAGGVALGVAVVGMYAREKQRERQAEQEGYAPVGLAAHQSDPLSVQLGAFVRGDQAEMFTGGPSLPNIPVWRNNIRQKAAAKKPGETLLFTWQYQDRSQPLPITRDVMVTYEKQPDGSWRTRDISDKPAGFSTPDLNRLIDPGVTDRSVEDMLTGPHA